MFFQLYFPRSRSFVCQLLVLFSDYLPKKPSFSVPRFWCTYVYSYTNRSSKWTHKLPKKQSYFAERCFFKFIPRDKGHFYTSCLFYILTVHRKSVIFRYLGCGICMDIPILTGIQNGRITS